MEGGTVNDVTAIDDAFDRIKHEVVRSIQKQGEEPFIVLSPGRLGGQATIGHRRISTEQVADTYWQHGFDELIRGYDITPGEVVVSCWYEARYGTRMRRTRWGEWLQVNEFKLWSPSFYGSPDAPSMEKSA